MTAPAFPFAERPRLEPPAEYARLPELCPVRLAGGRDALLASGYETVRTVLADPRFSRAAFTARPMFAREPGSLALVTSDPPGHGRRRGSIAHAFTARQARELRPDLVRLAGELLDDLRAAGTPADLVPAFTLPYPMLVMCRLLGIPDADRHVLKPWVDAMMSTSAYPPDVVAAAHQRMTAYFHEAVEAGRGLIGELRADPALTREEVVVLASGLLIAGYETTGNQLAIGAYLLLREPALVRRLRTDPSAVVDEILRWTPFNATGGIPHVATEDVPLGTTVVRAGQVVVPLTDAANRDPSVYPDPHRLDPDRPARPHLAFGYGRHRCPGAHLARVQLEVGLLALFDTFPDLALAVPEERLPWRHGMFVRGLWSLPVRWGPGGKETTQ
ncbi:MAG TPA: cytochrome P450 [Micromonosporaceae bacterium]|jgi:cytochrome P450